MRRQKGRVVYGLWAGGERERKLLDWSAIDTVLLDMDGTLLDLNFDNVLWNEYIPLRYAEHHGMSSEAARDHLFAQFSAHRHTLRFYCLDHWSEVTGMDVLAMHRELKHLICYRPHARAFLDRMMRSGRHVWLVTNAHRDGLDIKNEFTGLTALTHQTISSHDYGVPKESQEFWQRFAADHPFDKTRALFIDDNVEVLDAAHSYGIAQLRIVSQPDSARPPRDGLGYPAFNGFDEIMP
jgi:putative hydrolase of the HAD superfamily